MCPRAACSRAAPPLYNTCERRAAVQHKPVTTRRSVVGQTALLADHRDFAPLDFTIALTDSTPLETQT